METIDLIYKDVLTGETFECSCESYKIHSIERENKELSEWVSGRIIFREIKN